MSDTVIECYNDPLEAHRYARGCFRYTNLPGLLKIQEFKTITRRFLKGCIGRRILDVGCGEGRYSIELAKRNTVFAIDRSSVLLEVLSRRSGGLASLRVVNMDARRTSFPDDKFDIVLCVDFLHHYPDDQCLAILREIRRVLKPGGVLITEFKNAENPLIRYWYRRWMKSRFYDRGFYIKARTYADFQRLLGRASFLIRQTTGIILPLKKVAPAVVLRCAARR